MSMSSAARRMYNKGFGALQLVKRAISKPFDIYESKLRKMSEQKARDAQKLKDSQFNY